MPGPAQPVHPGSDGLRAGVLVVDDEPSVLSALSRLLRPDGIRVFAASGGDEALALLEEHGSQIGVVISDYAMPGMSGADLLRAVRMRWPDVTRVLLTGNADLSAAARAVNEGHLSRLYTKPWQPDEFRQAIAQALEQHAIVRENRRLRLLAEEQAQRLEQWNLRLEELVAERTAELERANGSLQRALLDTVRLLVTLLERRSPERAAHSREVARLAGRLAERAGLPAEEARRVQVAALIHDIGLVGLPDALLRRAPAELPPAGRLQYERHPAIGQSMLSGVEQLAEIGTWIRHHHERWDGRGYPDRLAGAAIPLASRLIALADGYLEAHTRLGGTASWWRWEQRSSGAYDPALLALLEDEVSGRSHGEEDPGRAVAIGKLRAGLVLAEELRTIAGAVLLPAGETLTSEHVERLRQLLADGALPAASVMVRDPPRSDAAPSAAVAAATEPANSAVAA